MPARPTALSESEAQLLMSQLIDGEISPNDADRLHLYLEEHPEATQWMESSQLAAEPFFPNPEIDSVDMWRRIRDEIAPEPSMEQRSSKVIAFPTIFKLIGAAAALALVASLVWKTAAPDSGYIATERYAASESVVEFVDTDIPGASPVVYTDEISGWTVVWVAEMEPIADETS